MIFKSMCIWKASGTLIRCLMTTHFQLFYVFKVLAKRQGFLVQWPRVRAQRLLMFPFSLWIFILFLFFLIGSFFFSFSRVLHNTILSLVVFVFFLRLYFTGLSMVPHIFSLYLSSLCPPFMHSAFLDFCCLRKPFQPFISYLLSYFSL